MFAASRRFHWAKTTPSCLRMAARRQDPGQPAFKAGESRWKCGSCFQLSATFIFPFVQVCELGLPAGLGFEPNSSNLEVLRHRFCGAGPNRRVLRDDRSGFGFGFGARCSSTPYHPSLSQRNGPAPGLLRPATGERSARQPHRAIPHSSGVSTRITGPSRLADRSVVSL